MLIAPLQNGQQVLVILQSQLASMVRALLIAPNGPSAAGHHELLGLQGGADNQPYQHHLLICLITECLVHMGRIQLHLMSYGALVSALNIGEKRYFQSAKLKALTTSGLVTLIQALSAPAGPVGTQVPVQCWFQGHLAHPCCCGRGVRSRHCWPRQTPKPSKRRR